MSFELLIEMLKMKRIDPLLGLDAVSRKYIVALIREQAPCGLQTLATLINEQDSTIGYIIEPTLFATNSFVLEGESFSGPLARPSRAGRIPTDIAERYIRECIRLQEEENWFACENLAIKF
jgi:Holliday junction resolvasome RuvABC ATP-dependent DNA helicase subunit